MSKILAAFEKLGFSHVGESDDQVFGECIFCGKEQKMYVSTIDGRWDCKSCSLNGNLYTLIREWYEDLKQNQNKSCARAMRALSKHRNISEETLSELGVLWDTEKERWIIPIHNTEGNLVNLQFYTPQLKVTILGMPELESRLGFVDKLKKTGRIFLTEGFWDAAALLEEGFGVDDNILWVPGANVFKEPWSKHFVNRDVVYAYDNDDAGVKGKQRVAKILSKIARSHSEITWHDEEPNGFDIRDLISVCRRDGKSIEEEIAKRTVRLEVKDSKGKATPPPEKPGDAKSADWREEFEKLPKLVNLQDRITFTETVEVYKNWLEMSQNMTDALKIIYAVLLSSDIEQGDPLWMHIVGPPGSGKTELLMSTSSCIRTKPISSIGPHLLISGFKADDDSDPSLIPDIIGRTLLVKDFTEVVRMHSKDKDLVYSILRGAYDGNAQRPFGNGVVRSFEGYFSIVTGVTQTIFGEADSPVGERFLMYHTVRGIGFDDNREVYAALTASEETLKMKERIKEAAKQFLDWRIQLETVPKVDEKYIPKIVALGQFVAQMRGTVDRHSYKEDSLPFRAQYEYGTRLAKQFYKLLRCLGLCNEDLAPTDEDYRIVVKVALDTCIGLNLEIFCVIMDSPNGMTVPEISTKLRLPRTTVQERLNNMDQLGMVVSEKVTEHGDYESQVGRPGYLWSPTEQIGSCWERAELDECEITKEICNPRVRQRFVKRKK